MKKIFVLFASFLTAGAICAQSYSVETDVIHGFLNDFSYDSIPLTKSYVMDYFNQGKNAGYRMDAPRPVRLSWIHQDGADAQRVEVSESNTYSDSIVFTIDKDTAQYDLYNMIPGRKYYYRVVSSKNSDTTIVKKGEIEPTGVLRMILAEGTWNVRDMGGWKGLGGHPIAYGKIFRGAQLIAPKDPFATLITANGKEALRNAGIRAELDLRSTSQVNSQVSAMAEKNGNNQYDVDFKNISESVNARMLNYDKNDANIRELQWVIDELKAGKPVFYHCQNGADRTGTLGFLIGALLGMGESDLAKDYELTTFCERAAAEFDPTEEGFARLRNYVGKKGSPLSGGDNADEYKYARLVEKMATVEPIDGSYQRKIYNFFKTGALSNGTYGTKISEQDLNWFIKYMVDYVIVSDITIDCDTKVNMEIGQTLSLNAVVLPDTASVKTITYSSSDEMIAVVSDKGVITAIGGGDADIRIQADDYVKIVTVKVPLVESYMPDTVKNGGKYYVPSKNMIYNGSFEYGNHYKNWKNGTGNVITADEFDLKKHENSDSVYIESKLDGDKNSEGSIFTEWIVKNNKTYVFGYRVRNSTNLTTSNNDNLKAMLTTKGSTDYSKALILESPSYDGNWTDIEYVFSNTKNYNRFRVEFTHLSQNGNNTCLDNFYLAEVNETTGVRTIIASFENGKAYDLNGRTADDNADGIIIQNGKKYLNKR